MNAVFVNTIPAATAIPVQVSTGDSFLIALIGIFLVLAVLVVLMVCIQVMGFVLIKSPQFVAKHSRLATKLLKLKHVFKRKNNHTQQNIAVAVKTEHKEIAKGTYGDLTLINTDEREAVMIMAIVADATETPLNELRFKSIKRIDGGALK